MLTGIEPIEDKSLKQACVQQLERLIFSGQWEPGMRLPAERQLAKRMGVSRPVLHQALVDLAAKGLVSIEPRRGVYVNPFDETGSLALLASLLSYHQDGGQTTFLEDMMAFRTLLEMETARLAAENRSTQDLTKLRTILEEELHADVDPIMRTDLDFNFHLRIAHASGNLLYPMILNSFKSVYTSFTSRFFRRYCESPVAEQVLRFHEKLLAQIDAQAAQDAAQTMFTMLEHGERHLKGLDHD